MITHFDAMLTVGILITMLLSSEPKKSAIAVVFYISLIGIALDYFFEGWVVMNLASIVESMSAILLFSYARRLEHHKDRIFFYMMSAFLFSSASTVHLYKYDLISLPSDYVAISHAVALSHLTFMVTFSDGFGIAIRNLRDIVAVYRNRPANSRG